MVDFKYKVVPFIGTIKGSQGAELVSTQLQGVIDEYVSQGWEFYELTNTNIEVRPGCIAGLFGASVTYSRFDQIIFRKTT